MTGVVLDIDLPEALIRQAREAGLLESEAVERLLREALLARRTARLAEMRASLAERPLPPMTTDEIQAEIDAYRSDSRRAPAP